MKNIRSVTGPLTIDDALRSGEDTEMGRRTAISIGEVEGGCR